jgi:hypothetical protein
MQESNQPIAGRDTDGDGIKDVDDPHGVKTLEAGIQMAMVCLGPEPA